MPGPAAQAVPFYGHEVAKEHGAPGVWTGLTRGAISERAQLSSVTCWVAEHLCPESDPHKGHGSPPPPALGPHRRPTQGQQVGGGPSLPTGTGTLAHAHTGDRHSSSVKASHPHCCLQPPEERLSPNPLGPSALRPGVPAPSCPHLPPGPHLLPSAPHLTPLPRPWGPAHSLLPSRAAAPQPPHPTPPPPPWGWWSPSPWGPISPVRPPPFPGSPTTAKAAHSHPFWDVHLWPLDPKVWLGAGACPSRPLLRFCPARPPLGCRFSRLNSGGQSRHRWWPFLPATHRASARVPSWSTSSQQPRLALRLGSTGPPPPSPEWAASLEGSGAQRSPKRKLWRSPGGAAPWAGWAQSLPPHPHLQAPILSPACPRPGPTLGPSGSWASSQGLSLIRGGGGGPAAAARHGAALTTDGSTRPRTQGLSITPTELNTGCTASSGLTPGLLPPVALPAPRRLGGPEPPPSAWCPCGRSSPSACRAQRASWGGG